MNRVIHFEIHASEPSRAAKFYSTVFGWDVKEWIIPAPDMPEEYRYWLVCTGSEREPGIDGGLLVRRGPTPVEGQAVNAFICTIGVASVDDTVEKAGRAGGSIALPKMPIPGVGWLAYCKDTEGNIFGVMQSDETAG